MRARARSTSETGPTDFKFLENIHSSGIQKIELNSGFAEVLGTEARDERWSNADEKEAPEGLFNLLRISLPASFPAVAGKRA